MKSLKGIIIAGMFFLLAGVGISLGAHTAHADTCDISAADFAQLTAVQNDPTLSASQELQQELAIRKQLVGKTITCAEGQVQTLQTAVASTTPVNGSDAIQSQLLDQLNDANNFYTIEANKLTDAGISGTQSVARDVLAYRKGTYTTLVAQISNFSLWTQNQNLFAIAATRMDQTQRAVSFLESASPNSDLQTAFDQAYASFQAAQSQNQAAQTALADSLSPDQSLSLIKESLNSLATTYQGFFNVSTIINKILPQ